MLRKIFSHCTHTPTLVQHIDTPRPEPLTPHPDEVTTDIFDLEAISRSEHVEWWLSHTVQERHPTPENTLTLEPLSDDEMTLIPFSYDDLTLEPLCGPAITNHIYTFHNLLKPCTVCEGYGAIVSRWVGCDECELGLCRTCYNTCLTTTHK